MSTSDKRPPIDEMTADLMAEDYNAIVEALAEPQEDGLRTRLTDVHPADFSDQFEQLSADQREEFIGRAGDLISADVLAELEDEIVEDILPLLPSAQIAHAITELDNDDATQIIEEMEAGQRAEVFGALEPEDRAARDSQVDAAQSFLRRLAFAAAVGLGQPFDTDRILWWHLSII